jgi:N-methylhydantoinase A
LKPGTLINGPVILEERESTLVVPIAADVKILADYTVAVTIRQFT